MADPELRKAALEASGLTVEMWPCYHDLSGYWRPYWDLHGTFDALGKAEKARWKDKLGVVDIREDNPSRYTYAAAVESDPGAFWPWFLQWISERDANFVLYDWFSDVQQTIRVFGMELMFKDGGKVQKQGVTVEEAGCKAVIAAAKRKEQA